MAVTTSNHTIRNPAPAWPALHSLPMEQIRFTYDGPSNTLFVDLYGRALPAASFPLALGDHDYHFLRVDVGTNGVVGRQIESYLTYALAQHPGLVDALAFADLVGTDHDARAKIEEMATGRGFKRRDRATGIRELVRLGA